jgi:acyl-CoA dehydrogenase
MKSTHSLVNAVKKIATEIAAKNSVDVDRNARFPTETIAALKREKLLSAAVPTQYGGAGCSLRELAEICSTLSQTCGSSGMVLAMHYIQVGCIARHGQGSAFFQQYLLDIVEHQYLLASITSEVGTSGDTRSSVCAVERKEGRYELAKEATTGSYCDYADAILVTCRRGADSPASDQVIVLAVKGNYTLQKTTSWDTLGMRGTCSPGFKFSGTGAEDQILPGPFADSSAQTMVPYSHILWASLWWGIAADALGRAGAFVRADARKKPGTVPPAATRLAEASVELQSMKMNWLSVAEEFDAVGEDHDGLQELLTMGWALKLNNLKILASTMAPQIVHKALQIIGIMGFKNDSPFSVGRNYRDVLSASLMVSNERVAAKNASMLLVLKDH